MYCMKCGKEIPDEGSPKFCPQCGVSQMSLPTVAVKKTSNAVIILIVLVVVSVPVTGIIAAIAIPQFASYRIKGANSMALSEIKNAKVACESFYADNRRYPDNLFQAKFSAQPGLDLEYQVSDDRQAYMISVTSSKGDRDYTTSNDRPEIFFKLKTEPEQAYRAM